MRIIALKSENIKNLKVVEINPNEDAVILEGKNGAGKSAVLDSIFMALTGKKIDEPIRNGEDRAEINVDLGDYRVRKIFTAKGERLEVISKDGAKFTSPQAMLDKILGKLTFDPLEFAWMKEKQQQELLAKLVGLDFTTINAARAAAYNARTIKNRQIKGGDPTEYRSNANSPLPLESLVAQMDKPDNDTPRQEINIAEAIHEANELRKKRMAYEETAEDNRSAEAQAKQVNDATLKRIGDIRAEIEEMQEELRIRMEILADLESRPPAIPQLLLLPDFVSDDEIAQAEEKVLQAEKLNKKIRAAIEYDKKVQELGRAKEEIAELEETMMKCDLEKARVIKEAVFPIEGLGITDEYVTYKDKPIRQLSTGEQVRISTAIAMALNPTLKVLLIREGSLLDKTGLDAVIELAKAQDYQLWIERVADAPDGCGIYLEEGEVKL